MTPDLLHDFWLHYLSPWLHSLIHPSFLHHRRHVLQVSFLSLLPLSRKSGVQWPLFILHHLRPYEYLCWYNSLKSFWTFCYAHWSSLRYTEPPSHFSAFLCPLFSSILLKFVPLASHYSLLSFCFFSIALIIIQYKFYFIKNLLSVHSLSTPTIV